MAKYLGLFNNEITYDETLYLLIEADDDIDAYNTLCLYMDVLYPNNIPHIPTDAVALIQIDEPEDMEPVTLEWAKEKYWQAYDEAPTRLVRHLPKEEEEEEKPKEPEPTEPTDPVDPLFDLDNEEVTSVDDLTESDDNNEQTKNNE